MSSKERKDAMYEHHPFGEAAVEERLESAKKYRGREVLVAGCGAGTRLFDRYFEGANVTGLDQSSRAIEFVRAQFDFLCNRRGAGVYTLTIHPDVHGKPHMIPLLEEFIQHVKDHEDAEFQTLETVARKYEDDPSVYESDGEYI
nr:class I SAM-dependent methyltransferase [Haladaptatus salinisoli]